MIDTGTAYGMDGYDDVQVLPVLSKYTYLYHLICIVGLYVDFSDINRELIRGEEECPMRGKAACSQADSGVSGVLKGF